MKYNKKVSKFIMNAIKNAIGRIVNMIEVRKNKYEDDMSICIFLLVCLVIHESLY